MSTSALGTIAQEPNMEELLSNKQAIWESAYQSMITSGGAVKVPLNLGSTFLITNKSKKEVVPFGALNYLFMYRDSLQNIHTEWVTLFPDEDWLYGNRSQYTGFIEVKTWEGKPIKSYIYTKLDQVNTAKSLSLKKMATLNKISDVAPNENIPTIDNVVCISFANSSKCTCLNKNNCDLCWQCTSNICRMYPAGANIPEVITPTGGGSTGGNGPSSHGPSGGLGGGPIYPDYAPLSCDPDPNYKVPQYPAPAGSEWMMPCNGPGAVPIPTTQVSDSFKLNTIINRFGITDPAKQNFLLLNDDIYLAIDNYLNINVTSIEQKDFINWAVGHVIDNPGSFDQAFKDQLNGIYNENAPIYIPNSFDVSYIQQWYDDEDELGVIDLAMIQQGVSDTDPIPEAYYIKNMGIDMSPATPRNGHTVHGNPRNAKYFWEQLMKRRPEMFSKNNRMFIQNNDFKSVVVDDQWIKYNPTHKSYISNQLVHHHHKQRNMAFAIPQKVHQKWTSILHKARINGRLGRLGGRLNSLGPFLELFSIVTDIKTGNPDAFVNGFGSHDEIGKLYKEPLQNFYFEITQQQVFKNTSGTVTRAIVTYDAYEDYIWDEDERRYMGVLKIATYVEDIDVINHRTNRLTKQ